MNIKELDVFSLLNGLDIGESTGFGDMHPEVLEEMTNFTTNVSIYLHFKADYKTTGVTSQ